MKTLTLVFTLIFFGSHLFAQNPVVYKVQYKPLHIKDNPEGKVLVKVPRNKTLMIYSYNQDCECLGVKYKDFKGYISSSEWLSDVYASTDPSAVNEQGVLDDLALRLPDSKEDAKATGDPESEAIKAAEVAKIKGWIKKYGYTNAMNIVDGKIWLGMTIDMALDSWGIPYRVNRSLSDMGNNEQWTYSDITLYFENGVLSDVVKSGHPKD